MTDKEKIRKKVKRLIDELTQEKEKGFGSDVDDACILELQNVVTFIDSLQDQWELVEEPVSDDFEEEMDRYIEKNFYGSADDGFFSNRTKRELEVEDIVRIGCHFAAWQKEQDQSTIELAEDHAMFAGMEKMREQMMKDAIDGEIFDIFYPNGDRLEISAKIPENKFQDGDKVKIIIIKKEK